MRATKKTKDLLTKQTPKVTQLNKKVVLALLGVVFMALAFIVISALSKNGSTPLQPLSDIAKSPSVAVDTTVFDQLPGSYESADQIRKIMQRGMGKQGFSEEVTQELSELRKQQMDLLSQIASMKAQDASQSSVNSGANSSPLFDAASSSAVFVPGGVPAQLPPLVATKDSDSDNASGASKDSPKDKKLDFITSKPTKEIYNDNTVQYPASRYILQAGGAIPAILKTSLSSDNPGYITAVVSQDVYDSINGQYLLIPKGSILLGMYSADIVYGQKSLQAKFIRLIRPDGSSIVLPNEVGTDEKGISGLRDQVNNHWGQVIGSAVLSAVFNIPAIVATNQMNINNVQAASGNTDVGSIANASMYQSVGNAASAVGGKIADRSLALQPTLTIRAGYQFSVMVTRDIVLPPYPVEGNV